MRGWLQVSYFLGDNGVTDSQGCVNDDAIRTRECCSAQCVHKAHSHTGSQSRFQIPQHAKVVQI